jgi:hypothetical protein
MFFFFATLCINDGRIFATRKLFTQSAIELPNVEEQDQRVEGIGRGVFLLSSLNSAFCDLSMILVGTNWTSGRRSWKTKLVKRK